MRELERRCGCTLSVVPCDAAQGLYSTVYVHEHPVGVFCEFYDTCLQGPALRDRLVMEQQVQLGFTTHDNHSRAG